MKAGEATFSTVAGQTDIVEFIYDGTNYWGVINKNYT